MKSLLFLFSFSFFLASCEKSALSDDISSLVEVNEGVLRVECSDCELTYKINRKEVSEKIKEGNRDISFSYSIGSILNTQIISKTDQSIRLLILDSDGMVISNELVACTQGEIKRSRFYLESKQN